MAGIAALASAVAAVLVIGAAVVQPDSGGSNAQFGASTPAASVPPPWESMALPQDAPLEYRPTWLPPGVSERSRSWARGAGVTRAWTRDQISTGGLEKPQLTLETSPALPTEPAGRAGTPVDINGRPGFLVTREGSSTVEWAPRDDLGIVLRQDGLALSAADLLKVARSVRPDPGRFEVLVGTGWLPEGVIRIHAAVDGDSPRAWRARLTFQQWQSGRPREWLSVWFGTATDAPDGGQSITVGGRPARVVAYPPPRATLYLVVDYGQGRLLTVSGNGEVDQTVLRADLLRIAERVEIDNLPDLSWLNSR